MSRNIIEKSTLHFVSWIHILRGFNLEKSRVKAIKLHIGAHLSNSTYRIQTSQNKCPLSILGILKFYINWNLADGWIYSLMKMWYIMNMHKNVLIIFFSSNNQSNGGMTLINVKFKDTPYIWVMSILNESDYKR